MQYHGHEEESVGLLLEAYKSGGEEHIFEQAWPSGNASHGPVSLRLWANKSRLRCPDRKQLATTFRLVWHALRPHWATPYEKRKIYATSWLDGLRGLAALFVVMHHASRYVGGLRQDVVLDLAHTLDWPIVAIIVSGTSMVDIFFVVSGYCLSYKTLKNARAGKHDQIYEDLSSSTFRRAIRLFLPCLAVSFVWAMLAYIGYDVRSPQEATLAKQLYTWVYDCIQATSPYRIVTNTSAFAFGDVFWTIPIEFRGSMHVYLCLLALSRARNAVRLTCLVLLQTYLSLTGRWDVLLFNSGMLCCEIHLIYADGRSTSHHPTTSTRPHRFLALPHRLFTLTRGRTLNTLLLLFALFHLSRQHDPHNRGVFTGLYSLFHFQSPVSWLAAEQGEQGVGAGRPLIIFSSFTLVLQLGFLPQFRNYVLESRFAQYMGHISYALYLTHSTLLDTAGDWCFDSPWVIFHGLVLEGREEAVNVYAVRLVVWLVCMAAVFGPLMCWVSDLFERFVDRKCIILAKWVESRCFKHV